MGLQRKASVANNTESLNGLKNGEEFDNAPLLRKSLSNVIRQNKMTSSIVQRESKKGVAQGVLLRDDEACIESFANDVYEEKNYEAGKFGHFKAKYTPGSRNLDVTLPVRYENSMNLLK